jgi:hypothetical protein
MARTRDHHRRQLTLEVGLHPDLAANRDDGREPYLAGTLKLKGDLHVGHDLDPGEELQIAVTGPDGELVTQGKATVLPPHFKNITDHGSVIGLERAHTAELED